MSGSAARIAEARPRLGARATACLVLLACATALSGCGYRTGLAPAAPGQPLPEEALDSVQRLALEGLSAEAREAAGSRTLGVQIFGNESLLPNLERDLHAAFTNAARRHAAMRLVQPKRADLFIRGRIADFNRGIGARTANNRAVETIEILTIEAELVDGATGKVLGRAQAQPAVGTAIDVPGREVEIRERALSNAADRLLLLLLAGLEYGVTRPGDPLLPETRPPSAETPRDSGASSPRPGAPVAPLVNPPSEGASAASGGSRD